MHRHDDRPTRTTGRCDGSRAGYDSGYRRREGPPRIYSRETDSTMSSHTHRQRYRAPAVTSMLRSSCWRVARVTVPTNPYSTRCACREAVPAPVRSRARARRRGSLAPLRRERRSVRAPSRTPRGAPSRWSRRLTPDRVSPAGAAPAAALVSASSTCLASSRSPRRSPLPRSDPSSSPSCCQVREAARSARRLAGSGARSSPGLRAGHARRPLRQGRT